MGVLTYQASFAYIIFLNHQMVIVFIKFFRYVMCFLVSIHTLHFVRNFFLPTKNRYDAQVLMSLPVFIYQVFIKQNF